MATWWLALLPDANSKCARVSYGDWALALSCRKTEAALRDWAEPARGVLGRHRGTHVRTPRSREHARDLSENAREAKPLCDRAEGERSEQRLPVRAAMSTASSGHAGPVGKAGGTHAQEQAKGQGYTGEIRRNHLEKGRPTPRPSTRPASAAACRRGAGAP